ncbi:MAG: RNA polymerase-associated protein RapA [Gammaproteobacteria bacterium]|nr:RNA polymerase-associated protein RapA [Gammaproteobacteria bacterium]
MFDFIPGQRCISDAESQMGLGTILKVGVRTVTVVYIASGDTRTYARENAPLTRVEFAVGDTIQTQDGVALTIEHVDEQHGLLTYCGADAAGNAHEVPEALLDNFLQLNRPSERLFNGQIDKHAWFELRYQTLQALNRLGHSDLYGLVGSRTSLIPHQLYIAHEVANRYAPRVLLADEVGLGKTIEAGLILHHQLLTERAHRVLIVVPETLVHQWLVEMLRRFNRHFRIFDEARLDDDDSDEVTQTSITDNPFMSEQLVLCSTEFLTAKPQHFQHCMQAEWDLLVVDEAHHLLWSPQHASDEYRMVEQLAAQTRGVLLLTATPEQLGKESHFARLRLLDPQRFPDYDEFIEEEQNYAPIAQVVEDLLENRSLTEADLALLQQTIVEGDNQVLLEQLGAEQKTLDPCFRRDDEIESRDDESESKDNAGAHADNADKRGDDDGVNDDHDSAIGFERNGLTQEISKARLELVEHLLDRHGTGRVLFRNTRAAVKGFPARKVFNYALPMPESYAQILKTCSDVHVSLLLAPELLHESIASGQRWTGFDPRLPWLQSTLETLYPQKVLVIAASAETALDIAWFLKNRSGIHTAVFHEGLSIVERDRAAAFFADVATGAQVLVCSEIGSEGRNFQFAHHLVLFDLPLNPDLLEQRIGRLDRIGQNETINLHIPYLEGSAQHVMFRWYHEGLSAFEHTCPAGHSVFVEVQDRLQSTLRQAGDSCVLEQLISDSFSRYTEMTADLHQGRDRLLEYNSCRSHVAATIKQRALEHDATTTLADFMERVFDCFGVDSELHSENCLIIRPTEHMVNRFPGLADDGMTITYDRDTALSFEDAHYLTWEHAMVRGAIDLVVSNEFGNTALSAVRYRGALAGTVLLECLFVLEAATVETLQSQRYLPPTTIRVVMDERGQDHADTLTHNAINQVAVAVDSNTSVQVVRAKRNILKTLLRRCEQHAQQQAPAILNAAHADAETILMREINRLKALQLVNPNVRGDEIMFFEKQLQALSKLIDATRLRLDALRVIVAM